MGGYKFLFESVSTMNLILRMQRDFSAAQMCCRSRSPVPFLSPACMLLPLLPPTPLRLCEQVRPAKLAGNSLLFFWRDRVWML